MENFVENYPLTAGDASIGAGFNRLMKRGAIFFPFKINQLENMLGKKKNSPENFSLAFIPAFIVHKMQFATNRAA